MVDENNPDLKGPAKKDHQQKLHLHDGFNNFVETCDRTNKRRNVLLACILPTISEEQTGGHRKEEEQMAYYIYTRIPSKKPKHDGKFRKCIDLLRNAYDMVP